MAGVLTLTAFGAAIYSAVVPTAARPGQAGLVEGLLITVCGVAFIAIVMAVVRLIVFGDAWDAPHVCRRARTFCAAADKELPATHEALRGQLLAEIANEIPDLEDDWRELTDWRFHLRLRFLTEEWWDDVRKFRVEVRAERSRFVGKRILAELAKSDDALVLHRKLNTIVRRVRRVCPLAGDFWRENRDLLKTDAEGFAKRVGGWFGCHDCLLDKPESRAGTKTKNM